MRKTLLRFAATILVLSQLSCATGGLVPGPPSMPIARLGLDPEHRIFFDTLIDYGDWILIEPIGYVFRPRISFESWSPYGDGFWVPTDVYGWVWISKEPFGWATYHYGRWLADPFQGWVWTPDTQWGPGWVSWTTSSGFVGWAPLPPNGYSAASIPGNGYQYVQPADLGASDLASRRLSTAQVAKQLPEAQPIENVAEVDGVRFNRGPDFATIERVAGPLHKVKIDALVPVAADDGTGTVVRSKSLEAPDEPLDEVSTMRRAGEEAAREARRLAQKKNAVPERFTQIKVIPGMAATPPAKRPANKAPASKAPVSKTPATKAAERDSS